MEVKRRIRGSVVEDEDHVRPAEVGLRALDAFQVADLEVDDVAVRQVFVGRLCTGRSCMS